MVKTAVVVYFKGAHYKGLAQSAFKSAKHFHENEPNLNVFLLEDTDPSNPIPVGIKKLIAAYELATKGDYEKLIILGADTITCHRLDEFLDDDTTDVLATVDYPYRIPLPIKGSDENNHVNADVVCFNNLQALKQTIEIAISGRGQNYFEQGALNYLLFSEEYDFTHKIVDSPYPESKVAYNARAKGNITSQIGIVDFKPYISKWRVDDNKLYTHDDCLIKLWHFCQGLGGGDAQSFNDKLSHFVSIFNEDTIRFFKDNCTVNLLDICNEK